MSKKKNVPEIRFKGFTHAWEQRKLGEIAKKRTQKNVNRLVSETFTNSAELGVISQLEYFDHDIANEENIASYYLIQALDFVYNPRISSTAPCGPINCNYLGRTGIMSPLYTIFSVVSNVDKAYLSVFFKTDNWHPYMYLEGNTGARSDRFSINDTKFFGMPILLPELEEQQKIGAYFKNLDSLITLHQRKSIKIKIE